jgi:hypothetical protein
LRSLPRLYHGGRDVSEIEKINKNFVGIDGQHNKVLVLLMLATSGM